MPNKTIAQAKRNNKEKIIEQFEHKNLSFNIRIDTKTIKNMFRESVINNIAQDSRFIQRQRKLDAYEFFYH